MDTSIVGPVNRPSRMKNVTGAPKHDDGASAPRGAIESIEQLVPMQFGILYGCLTDESKKVYMGQWVGTLLGPFDPAAFKQAWQLVVDRHTILRTAFEWQLKADPIQIVIRNVPVAVEFLDLSDTADTVTLDDQVKSFLQADCTKGFDLARPPLMRLALLRLSPQRHVLVWTRHHLICDGWSLAELFDELFTCYHAILDGHAPDLPPAVPFGRYVAWWTARDLQSAEQFWRERLVSLHFGAVMASARRGTETDFSEQIRLIDSSRLADFRDACRAHRVTLNTLVQGAWALVLARHRDSDDVVFGATETMRPDDIDLNERCLGPQINTLPVVVRAWQGSGAGAWLRAVQASAIAARQHGKISLPEIAACCGSGRGQDLFDSVLVFQNYPTQASALPKELGLTLESAQDISIPDLPINLIVEPGDHLLCRLIHDRTRVDDNEAKSLLQSLDAALQALAKADAAPLWTVDIRPDLQPRYAGLTVPSADPQITILHHIAEAPDEAIALVQGGRQLTFGELRGRAKGVAGGLVQQCGAGKRIGLLCRHSIESVIAVLGILWSGGAYVPLDPTLPRARLAGMASDADLSAVVADPAVDAGPGIQSEMPVPVLPFASLDGAVARRLVLPAVTPNSLAYVIFTSGSTGRPKGVMVPHHALLAIIDARPAVFPEPIGGALLTFPLFFDGSVTMLFSTLARGARLVLPDPSPVIDATALCRTIARAGVTHTLMVPSLYAALLEAAEPAQLRGLTTCAVAGEACDAGLVRRHFNDLPRAALVNEYGPTETTVWATLHRCHPDDGNGIVPIGRAIKGVRVYLLDSHLRPTVPGTAGEVFIAGCGISWGYVGNPGLTAERFLPDPWSVVPGARMYRTGDRAVTRADGHLVFLGRNDRQIKLRGYRIELGEIEAALAGEPGAAEIAVLVRGDPPRLVAYVTGRPGEPMADQKGLQQALVARVPAYMVPTIVVLPSFPRLPNGKLDRNSLHDPIDGAADPGPAPEPGDEAALAALWREVLGCDFVSATRDFFDLGGTSLLGMRLVALIRTKLGSRIELYDLFRNPTVRALARVVATDRVMTPGGVGPIARRQRPRVTAAPLVGA